MVKNFFRRHHVKERRKWPRGHIYGSGKISSLRPKKHKKYIFLSKTFAWARIVINGNFQIWMLSLCALVKSILVMPSLVDKFESIRKKSTFVRFFEKSRKKVSNPWTTYYISIKRKLMKFSFQTCMFQVNPMLQSWVMKHLMNSRMLD